MKLACGRNTATTRTGSSPALSAIDSRDLDFRLPRRLGKQDRGRSPLFHKEKNLPVLLHRIEHSAQTNRFGHLYHRLLTVKIHLIQKVRPSSSVVWACFRIISAGTCPFSFVSLRRMFYSAQRMKNITFYYMYILLPNSLKFHRETKDIFGENKDMEFAPRVWCLPLPCHSAHHPPDFPSPGLSGSKPPDRPKPPPTGIPALFSL